MKDYVSAYLSSSNWLIHSRDWSPQSQAVNEAIFTLGNGYLGSRGILEELPEKCKPGTYIAGVFDKSEAVVPEIVNTPNVIDFQIFVGLEKLDISKMTVVNHKCSLDMQKGILTRRTIFSDSRKRSFDYQSLRFFSKTDEHIGAMQVFLTSLDTSAIITVQDSIDGTVTNRDIHSGDKIKHTHLIEASEVDRLCYLCVETNQSKVQIANGSYLDVTRDGHKVSIEREINKKEEKITRKFSIKIKEAETICFTKLFSIYTSRDILSKEDIKNITIKSLNKMVSKGFKKLIWEHIESWKNIWKTADISIKGDPEIERIIRFNIYHMLISGNEGNPNVSIGAKSLSGEGYGGHIFWETEIYLSPFFIYNNPRIARNLLMYRCLRLDTARQNAKERGFQGAMFPWESADTGEEVAPPYHKRWDGTPLKVVTMEMEHHIVCDIAYGIFHYYTATRDIEFMLKFGLETVLETARFWASRVEYNNKKDRYEIKKVIGPDEFHEGVNNNLYTNAMARWNLMWVCRLLKGFQAKFPSETVDLLKKINFSKEEIKKWKDIYSKIFLPFSDTKNLFEAFDGYFNKKDIIIPRWDFNFVPVLPKGIKFSEVGSTQVLKQADIVLLLYLLPELFSKKEKKTHFDYYETRTVHQSSLSASMHSIVALEVGEEVRAQQYFLRSANMDIGNYHGNTGQGMHAGSLGGTWQIMINGFAGMRINKGVLSFEPRLPAHWEQLSFTIRWHGFILWVSIYKDKIEVLFPSKTKNDKLPIKLYNKLYNIPANRFFSRHKKAPVPVRV